MSISAVARKYGIHPNQIFRWRKLVQEGAFTAILSVQGVLLLPVLDQGGIND